MEASGLRFEPGTIRAAEGARYVLCPTDDGRDDAYPRLRQAAIVLAARSGAKLLLADRSVGQAAPAGGVLGRAEVRRLGRAYLAEQIDEAAAAGVEAGAWLPAEGDAVQRLPVDVIVADRERGLPSGRAAGRATVVAVAADLTVRLGPGAAGA